MVKISKWTVEDGSCDLNEWHIFIYWEICFSPAPYLPHFHPQVNPSPSGWSCPPSRFVKINFDRSSKGNPIPVGFHVVFRNNQGHILHSIAGGIGHERNNATDLWEEQ